MEVKKDMELKLIQERVENKSSSGSDKMYAHHIGVFYDSETGVEYFVMNSANAGAMCPRIDKDGKPVVYKGR